MKVLRILGIRGVPAAHGGFETFAEYLSTYLVSKGWRVVVYCQEEGSGDIWQDGWQGVERVHIPVTGNGAKSTIVFDWKATAHAAQHKDLCLTLGYNTAIFCSILRLRGVRNVINMDGIEWSRAKWGPVAKTWFWLNDWAGSWLGNHLVADHPEIANHLSSRVKRKKITVIPYGAERIAPAIVPFHAEHKLEAGKYLTVIARAEPENSLLEIVKGFSAQPRGIKMVVLGNYNRTHAYQAAVLDAASEEVIFPGAIYDKSIVQALRYHCMAYVHGHQVGGTNPSLVEALGASNPVIAHDNKFNRWVAGDGAQYFNGSDDFSRVLGSLLTSPNKLNSMRVASASRFEDGLTWPAVLDSYEQLLTRFI